MRLKRLELFGFKSFADRSVLDFDRPLTGIVGPNGCGKSNVVDAMRWVLGETRPTSMRGGEMTDVIFKGSASRPPLGVAEVTMILDNSAGTLEEHGPEISVTRRVFKSGEGEYLIDGSRVRLKDVKEMLFDTGLGSRGYAVLEQGKIDAVLSANPLDRRAIFEEAAGVSRYRQRRKEAESRLKRVALDMERLDDVLGELTSRSRSLKIQAGKAERYVSTKAEWDEHGTRLARHRVNALDGTLTESRRGLAEVEGRVRELRELREGAEKEVREREAEQAVLDAEVERLGREVSEVSETLRATDERRAQLSERIHAWNSSAEAATTRAQELSERLVARRAELDQVREAQEELSLAARKSREEADAKGARLRELTARIATLRQECEDHNTKVLSLLHEKTSAGNRAQHLEQSLAPLAGRLERASERWQDAQRSLGEVREADRDAERDLERVERSMQGFLARREELEARAQAGRERLQRCDAELEEVRLERARLASRIESLRDGEADREAAGGGTQDLLARAEAGEAPAAAQRLRGLVADHLRIDSDHARALDAVLGERAQALALGSEEDARELAEWLSREERPPVRLVWPTEAPERRSPAETPIGAGIVGRLRDLVEVDAGFEGLAEAWLGDVLLVADRASARALGHLAGTWRLATPGGQLFELGSTVAGYRSLTQGPVGRRSHAADLEAELVAIDAREAELDADRARQRSDQEALAASLVEVGHEVDRGRESIARARAAREAAKSRLVELQESVTHLEAEVRGLERERDALHRELEEARERSARAEVQYGEESERLREREAEREALEADREELGALEGTVRVEATRLGAEVESQTQRALDLERGIGDLEAERASALASAEENRGRADEGAAELELRSEERVRLLESRAALEERLGESRERDRSGRDAIEELRRRVDAVTHEVEDLGEDVARRRLGVQRLELERDEVVRRALEDHGLDELALRRDFEEEPELVLEGALEELAARVQELRTALDRIGPVNVEALSELAEVSERLEFLETQREDLVQSRSTLEKTLRHLNDESERRFLEAFDEIRGHFQGIFRKLFGGGRADIQLEEGVPALEAGIEITARPPGREMLPIGLLSGGQRTLTALALLFSVFEARPSPFCVLDEVDAALDDANIARFLGMLGEFRSSSQFVIVTHNKGTMAACDLLYGVTMATKGVSRRVSVELSEVDEFVPEATGGRSAADEEGAPAPEVDEATGEPVVELVPERATRGEEEASLTEAGSSRG